MGRAEPTPRQEPAGSLALALSPAANSAGARPIFRVATERQLQAMCAEILDGARTSPIVGVTCRPGSRDPALVVDLVCEVVWANVPIYVIEPQQARGMSRLLPDGLGAYNGAVRVWMPGVREHTDSSWHPLIHDPTGVYGEDALRRLAAEFAIKPPGTADLTPEQQALVQVRSPQPPAVASEAPLLRVSSRKDLRRLLSDLRGDRDCAIIVITVGAGDEDPTFPPGPTRAALKDPASIFVLESADLCRRLAHALSPQLAVDGGDARIFWLGAGPDSDPAEHPLVPARSPGDSRSAVERLLVAFELSRPLVRRYLAPIQTRLAVLEEQSAQALSKSRESEAEQRRAVERAVAAETQLAGLQHQLAALQAAGLDTGELRAVAGMDREAVMQRLICREWLTALAAADRRDQALGGYRLAPQFMASVEDRRIATPAARIAFACAMVACGRAPKLPGLEPHPRREGKSSGGDDPQAVREDGAKAWMCNLGHGRGAARLFYWLLPDGLIEFDSVRNHEAIGRT
jgi:hypothetical protein